MEGLTIYKAHEAFRKRIFTARQLVEYYLGRIEAKDKKGPKVNSIVTVSSTALSEADRLDKVLADTGQLAGPLHGIPVIVKDQAATKGLRTTYGSVIAKDNIPDEDATVVSRLKEAGAIILAKSTMPDWATSWHSTSSLSGVTGNPYDLSRDAGGSSSGTGAAIAADFGILGVGEDTGGSIRLPASFCGLVGLRPTPGMISRYGMSPLVVPQDTPGPMCRTVTDVAVMFDAMIGFDNKDSYTTANALAGIPEGDNYDANLSEEPIKQARLGVVRALYGSDTDPECAPVNTVVDNALSLLQQAGTHLVDVEIPGLLKYFQITFMYASRSRSDLNNFFKQNAHLKTSVEQMYSDKTYHPALDLFEAIATGPGYPEKDPMFAERALKQDEFRRVVMKVMVENDLDALTFPDAKIAAPLLSDILNKRWSAAEFPTNTLLASQAILPAITLPVGYTENGLPVGLELVGLLYREQQLLDLAFGIEQILNIRRPPKL